MPTFRPSIMSWRGLRCVRNLLSSKWIAGEGFAVMGYWVSSFCRSAIRLSM